MVELFKLAGTVTVDGMTQVQKNLKGLEGDLRKAMKPMVRFGKQAERTGKILTQNLTLPLAAIGGAATKFAADFDKSLTTSLAIMGDVSEGMRKQMSDTAKTISKETTFSASELAKSYYYLASAGMSAEQSVAALGKVANFAAAGQFDLQIATDLLTDAQSALGLATDDVAQSEANMVRVSDVLVKANTLANASVQQFSEALTNKAGAALRILGKDVEEGVAVLAAYADQGTKGAEAGTQFSIVLRDLQKANQENAEEFRNAGIAVYDAAGEMRNMADVIGDVERALDGKSDAEKKATLTLLGFQERSIQSLLTLVGTSDAIREYEKELRVAAGTTDSVAKKQMQNFSDQMKILVNRLQVAAIELGEELIPVIQNNLIPIVEMAIEKISGLVQWFKNIPEPLKNATIVILGLTAAAGPLLIVLGKLAGAFTTLPAIIGAARLAVQLFTGALLSNPIVLVTYAVAGLTLALVNLSKAYKDVNKQIDENRKKMKDDIEAKQTELKTNLLKELIYHYEKLANMDTQIISNEEYAESKRAIDNLEKSIGDLGIEFTGGYAKRLRDARVELGEFNTVEMEAIDIMNAGKKTAEEIAESEEKRKKTLQTMAEIEKANFEVRKRRGEQELEIINRRKEATKKIQAWEKQRAEAREEFDQKYIELAATTTNEKIKLLEDERDAEIELAGGREETILNIKKHYQSEIDKLRDEDVEKEKKAQLDKMALVSNFGNQIGGLIQGIYDNEAIAIDNNHKREQKAIENSTKSQEEKEKALAELDEKYDKKRAALAKKQAIAEKAQSIFSIGINTAMAVVKSLPNMILAGIVGVIGATQAAIVAARPIPEMAEGGIIPKREGGTLVRAGEAGEDEGFIPMQKGTASIANAIINSMRRYPASAQGTGGGVGGSSVSNAVNLNVGTLIADEKGIMELERRLRVVRVSENNRLGII